MFSNHEWESKSHSWFENIICISGLRHHHAKTVAILSNYCQDNSCKKPTLCKNCAITRKINRPRPKSYQFWGWSGNLSKWTDGCWPLLCSHLTLSVGTKRKLYTHIYNFPYLLMLFCLRMKMESTWNISCIFALSSFATSSTCTFHLKWGFLYLSIVIILASIYETSLITISALDNYNSELLKKEVITVNIPWFDIKATSNKFILSHPFITTDTD